MKRQETQEERNARRIARRAAEAREAHATKARHRRSRAIEDFASYVTSFIERKEAEFVDYDCEPIDPKRL